MIGANVFVHVTSDPVYISTIPLPLFAPLAPIYNACSSAREIAIDDPNCAPFPWISIGHVIGANVFVHKSVTFEILYISTIPSLLFTPIAPINKVLAPNAIAIDDPNCALDPIKSIGHVILLVRLNVW